MIICTYVDESVKTFESYDEFLDAMVEDYDAMIPRPIVTGDIALTTKELNILILDKKENLLLGQD